MSAKSCFYLAPSNFTCSTPFLIKPNRTCGTRTFISHYNNTQLSHFDDGIWKIRLISHTTKDPINQHTAKKTSRPAKMVRKGGPFATSLLLVTSDPSEEPFDAYTGCKLCFNSNLTLLLNLSENFSPSQCFCYYMIHWW